MKQISVMIKPASSLCNMRCKYCFYSDVSSLREVASFGIMREETLQAVIHNIFVDLESGDQLTLAFQGGEPTLAGLDFYRTLIGLVDQCCPKGVRVNYALQTNGYLLNREWCEFLKQHHFLVGLSLDGPSQFHNANRLDAAGEGTFRKVLSAKKLMDEIGVEYNVLIVLTNHLARHPVQIWNFIKEQKLSYVQFIPCLGSLEGQGDVYALTPQRYASFYRGIFDLWYKEYRQGNYISIKLFDDLVNLLAFGQCNACGLTGRCHSQIIVEADGSTYPCDFYVLDEYCTGNLVSDSVVEILHSAKGIQFEKRPSAELSLCTTCPYRQICGGGCQRMRQEVCYRAGDTLCGHRMLLDSIGERLRIIAMENRRFAARYQG